ncbi:MAG: hypothetical protein WD273_14615 [Trueperaceae bacterium]
MTSLPSSREVALLEAIHASAPMMVMEFSGAGAQSLWWLHSVAGSSRTVLEATDRYTPNSLIEAVGFVPERFTSAEVASALAHQAGDRAVKLAAAGTPTFGLGLTATIATDRVKRGEHRCELAVQDHFGSKSYGLQLAKGERDRAGEEALVSRLVIRAIADACGVLSAPAPELLPGEELRRHLEPQGPAAEFMQGRRESLLVLPDGRIGEELPHDAALLSGSFNPLHRGHLRLAQAAGDRLGVQVVFELPLVNADKAEIGLVEARRRATQFLGHAPVLLTRAPLFSEKARLFRGRSFVVGIDTAARLLERRFYSSDERGSDEGRAAAMEELRGSGARFLVAGRYRDGAFLTLSDLDVPEEAHGLFQALPEEAFREDLSSSELRDRWSVRP